MSQFEALRDEMRDADPENGNMPIIRLTELFTFKVKPRRLNYLRGKKKYREIQQQRRTAKYNS